MIRFALKSLPAGAAARVLAGELLRLPAHPGALGRAWLRAGLELPEIVRLRSCERRVGPLLATVPRPTLDPPTRGL
jgi:hypothetical protein